MEESRGVEPDEKPETAADRREADAKERRIRRRAYEIWEREGRPEGQALDHWLKARWEIEIVPEGEFERLEREFGSNRDEN